VNHTNANGKSRAGNRTTDENVLRTSNLNQKNKSVKYSQTVSNLFPFFRISTSANYQHRKSHESMAVWWSPDTGSTKLEKNALIFLLLQLNSKWGRIPSIRREAPERLAIHYKQMWLHLGIHHGAHRPAIHNTWNEKTRPKLEGKEEDFDRDELALKSCIRPSGLANCMNSFLVWYSSRTASVASETGLSFNESIETAGASYTAEVNRGS
jgi:hypothetical protein